MPHLREIRRAAAYFAALAAAIELAASVRVLALGPFELRLGLLNITARTASKPFLIGVLLASVAVWLIDPLLPPAARSRMARLCTGLAFAAVLFGIIPLAAPIFLPDFPMGHDAGVHQTYSFLFTRALGQGQLPVRWVEGITPGTGQPLFNYYQVGFYYLVALIHWSGPGLSLSMKIAVAAQWSLGAVFVFLLCRPLGTLPALTGAAVFLWSPYLLLDAYVRSAYPELTAIGFAPGVIWSLDRVLRTGRPIFASALALTTGLVLVSHLPTAEIIAPLAAVYLGAASVLRRTSARRVCLALTGALTGAALAGFYIVPAILELDAIKIRRMTAGYFDYERHFVRPAWWFDWSWGYGASGVGAPDQLSLQIGIVQWAVLAAALVLLAVPALRRRAAASPSAILAWLLVVAGSLFMMTTASSEIWSRVGPMAFIQFPWRLLMLPVLACAVLSAIVLSAVRHRTTQALAVLCVVASQWYVTLPYREIAWTHERAAIAIDDPGWPFTSNARRWASREGAYDPVAVAGKPRPAVARWTLREGDGTVKVTAATDVQLRLETEAWEPLTLDINSPFVPGWRVSIDGEAVSPCVESRSGYMQVTVPAGVHAVDAVFANTWVRAAGNSLTLLGVFGCLTLAYSDVRRRPARAGASGLL
jgi:hypothetical protein